MKKIFPLLASGVLFVVSCNKSESPVPSSTTPEERSDPSSLNFSGYSWTVKNSGNALQGPGANYFSKNNVYVDETGILHLEISKQNNKWKCGELYSNDNFGYGIYIFNNSNPPRQGWDGMNFSNPIVIPAPGNETKAHINFWLFDKNGDGKGDAPKNKQNAELLIQRFQYIPQ